MNDKLKFIFNQGSVRKFTSKTVSDADLDQLLNAAMSAPSACKKDPWRFIVVRNRENLNALAEFLPNGKFLTTAPLGIIVCGDLEAAHAASLSYMLQDCSAAIENLLLAATALGLGACWLGVHPREDRIENISRHCQLPEKVLPVAVIAIGHPAETPEPRTRYNAAYIKQETWN